MINDFQLIGCIFNDTSNIFRGTALTSPTAFTSLTIKDCSFNVGSFVCQSNPNNNFNGLNAYIVHNLFKTLAVNTIFTTAGAVFNVLKLSNNIDINS
jgi:hypothetical protein